jgi:hypothetical protein
VSLTKAERALQAAQTLPEIKQIIDLAGAAKEYARAASLGESAAIYAEKIKLHAQRKAGGLLNNWRKAKPGGPKILRSLRTISLPIARLWKKRRSSKTRPRWQQVAAIPEEKFSAYIQTNEEKGKELTTAGAPGAVVRHSSEFCTSCERNAHGRIRRSSAARRPFQSSHPCPATGLPTGACPGFVVDHIVPLKRGGPDDPSNMQWQTVEEAKAKDRSEWYSVSCLITFGTVDAPESDAGER